MGTEPATQKNAEKKKEGSVLRKNRNQGNKEVYEHCVSNYGLFQ